MQFAPDSTTSHRALAFLSQELVQQYMCKKIYVILAWLGGSGYPHSLFAFVFRFFCGPHAKKSAALAKQQKKKPKGKGKTMEASGESE